MGKSKTDGNTQQKVHLKEERTHYLLKETNKKKEGKHREENEVEPIPLHKMSLQ